MSAVRFSRLAVVVSFASSGFGCSAAEDEGDPGGGMMQEVAATDSGGAEDTDVPPPSARPTNAAPDDGSRRAACGDDGTNSFVSGDMCRCFSGFGWCSADDLADFTCCSSGSADENTCSHPNAELVDGVCQCKAGFMWCSDDPNDLTCCAPGG